MPRVPSYDNFQVAPSGLPNARVAAPELPDVAGQQMQQTGQNLMRAGSAVGGIALDMQNEANKLRVYDSTNRAKELLNKLKFDQQGGFLNIRGIDALQRESGKPLADEYSDKFNEELSKIRDGLGNDAQKQAFMLVANDMLGDLRATATKHEADQFRDYSLSVREGTVANRMNDIALNYDKPDAINAAINGKTLEIGGQTIQIEMGLKQAVYDQAKLLGRSAEWADAQTRKLLSRAHSTALVAALEKNNLEYAQGYLKKYSGDMEADDVLRVQGMITKEMEVKAATTVAAEVVQVNIPRFQTNDIDRAFNILIGAESGGRQTGADGRPLTSKAGAIGVAQVMPATGPEAAKLAGLPWDEQRFRTDADYNRRLGRAYFEKQIRDFGGELDKAYAAYNAGPGHVRAAVERAGKAQPGTEQANWLWQLNNDKRAPSARAETAAYVKKNMEALAAGEGSYAKPSLQEMQQAALARLGPNASSRTRDLALDEVSRQYEVINKEIKLRSDEAFSNALRAMQQNGGDFNALSLGIRSAVPPERVDDLLRFGETMRKQGDVETDPALYLHLTRPENLRRLSDQEFFALRTKLKDSDFKALARERSDLLNPNSDKSQSPDTLNSEAINRIMATRLRMLKIDPTPKDGSADAMRVGAMMQTVRTSLLTAQAAAGKKFSEADIEKHLDSMFAKTGTSESGWFFRDQEQKRVFQMTIGDVPREARKKLEKEFKDRGVVDPTDGDILGAYMAQQFGQKPPASASGSGSW